MTNLKPVEIAIFRKILHAESGYVLNFSNTDFDLFTLETIGIEVQRKYNLSKWKSLEAFLRDPETTDILAAKLLKKLLEETLKIFPFYNDKAKNLYDDGQKIISRLEKGSAFVHGAATKIKREFNSEHISTQIEQMQHSITENPSDAIGKAKELLESCFKTILGERGVAISTDWDLPRLNKETCKILKLTPEDIKDEARASATIRSILGNLSAISQNIAELRNHFGSGHGKDSQYKGLQPRHAQLAVGVAITAVNFLWDTFKQQQAMYKK